MIVEQFVEWMDFAMAVPPREPQAMVPPAAPAILQRGFRDHVRKLRSEYGPLVLATLSLLLFPNFHQVNWAYGAFVVLLMGIQRRWGGSWEKVADTICCAVACCFLGFILRNSAIVSSIGGDVVRVDFKDRFSVTVQE